MNTNSDPSQPRGEAVNNPAGDLAAMELELARQKELYIRLAADFDNFRRRNAQEIERRAAAQKEAFIVELLPAIDNLERALRLKEPASPEQLRHGVQLTLQQLRQILHRHGIEQEESLGKAFEAYRHEAIGTRHDSTRPDQSVLEVVQRGYRRGKDVFRPAKVIVNDLILPGENTQETKLTEERLLHRGQIQMRNYEKNSSTNML